MGLKFARWWRDYEAKCLMWNAECLVWDRDRDDRAGVLTCESEIGHIIARYPNGTIFIHGYIKS